MSDRLVHIHHDGGIDAASPLTIDPLAARQLNEPVTKKVMAGIIARWDTVGTGSCSCGAMVEKLNRRQRRANHARFTYFCRHRENCPAMDGTVRSWHFMHRRMSI